MPTSPDEMTYEQARDELVGVVARLEAGGETLEGSLALWERGEALAARCQEWLDGARRRLDVARSATSDAATPEVAAPTATDAAAVTSATPRTTRTTRTTPAPPDPEDDR